MSVRTNTLTGILNNHYNGTYGGLGAFASDPGDTMDYSEVHDLTNFGKLLHKEGLWSLYSYKTEESLLFHLCRGYLGIKQENSPARPGDSRCTACDKEAPDEIRGLWTLHNFEWVQAYHGDDSV